MVFGFKDKKPCAKSFGINNVLPSFSFNLIFLYFPKVLEFFLQSTKISKISPLITEISFDCDLGYN